MVLCSSIVLTLPIWSVYWIKSSIRSQNNPKQRLLGIIYIFDVSAEKNNFVSTPDRRQWKTLLTIDKRGSEIASTSVFDCHLLPVGWLTDLGPNTLKSIQIHYNYFELSMITITLQLQDLQKCNDYNYNYFRNVIKSLLLLLKFLCKIAMLYSTHI